jgi:hypothetical protein
MTEKFNYPFVKMTEGEKPKLDTFTVRLNDTERVWLNELKKDLDIKGDSTALKFLAEIGGKVLHNTLGAKNTRYLFKKDRKRLSDYENFY